METDKFENPSKVKVATWETIKDSAEKIFNYYTYNEDFKWAETIWRKVEKTPLAYYSSETEHYSVILNFFSLAELFNIYNYLRYDEEYDRTYKYPEWVDELDLSRLKLVLLADEEYHDDEYIVEFDGIYEPLNALIEEKYSDFISELVKIMGGEENLLISLEKTGDSSGEDEDSSVMDDHIIDVNMSNYSVSDRTLRLFDWKEQGFPRDYC